MPVKADSPGMGGELSGRAFTVALALIALLFLSQALWLARVLVPSQDEIGTLFLGSLAASGQIGLYDDQVIGHRAPLPFYVFGVTQVLFGRNLLAGRLLAIAFGLVALVLTALLARRLGGALCGLLAAAFLAAQGAVVGYYSMADFHSMVPMIIAAGVLVWLSGNAPWRNVAGTGILASLFFVRTHVMPVIPFALGYGLWRSRTAKERWAVLAVTALPPLAFFLSDERHLKLLANVTFVNRFVRRLGYLPPLSLDARHQETFLSQVWWLIRLARRYEFLLLAAAVAVVLVAWRVIASRRADHYLKEPKLHLVAALFLYLLGFQFVFFHINFKWIGMYAVSFAPLLVTLLGFAYSRLLSDADLSAGFKRALVAFLLAVMALPIYYNRNPVLPIGEMRAADPYGAAHVAAAHLARAVPKDAKVFFFGSAEVYYLSGLPATYFPQVYNFNQLAVLDQDNRVTVRSGFYGMPQVERWLSSDAEYAVISPWALKTYGDLHPEFSPPKVARIQTLLAQHFEFIDRVDEYPYYSYDVYRRKRG